MKQVKVSLVFSGYAPAWIKPCWIKFSGYGFLICLMLLLSMLFLGSCSRTQAGYADNDDAYAGTDEEDSPDELVEAPDLPQDDGVPLSFAERVAFRSTGFLDAALTAEDLQMVERHFKYYIHNHRKTLELYLGRSGDYLAYVRKVFMENGVPEEIVYLAVVESGFNPRAVSRAGATGMWQFMPATGRYYGLIQNYWIDERRDPFKSTLSAAAYLKMLQARFGDWLLAVAAYNAGENRIEQALRGTGAHDFFNLCRLNDNIPHQQRLKLETRQYVPRLLAVVKIMRNLEILGFIPPEERRLDAVMSVKIKPGTDLGALASGANLRLEEFKALNPAYRTHISPPDAGSTAYVPADNGDKAVAWLNKAGNAGFAGWQRYQIRRGDSISALANRYGISSSLLLRANNLKNNTLREGSVIVVPGTRALVMADAGGRNQGRPQIRRTVAAGSTLYTVRRGDSLYSIARAYGIRLESLRKANNIRDNDAFLVVGQKLGIPAKDNDNQAPVRGSAGESRLIVRRGDTLYSIAARNNTSVEALLRLNGLEPNKPILPGQELRLP